MGPPDLANLRENYVSTGIDDKSLPSEPHKLMEAWIQDACNCQEVGVLGTVIQVAHRLIMVYTP